MARNGLSENGGEEGVGEDLGVGEEIGVVEGTRRPMLLQDLQIFIRLSEELYKPFYNVRNVQFQSVDVLRGLVNLRNPACVSWRMKFPPNLPDVVFYS